MSLNQEINNILTTVALQNKKRDNHLEVLRKCDEISNHIKLQQTVHYSLTEQAETLKNENASLEIDCAMEKLTFKTVKDEVAKLERVVEEGTQKTKELIQNVFSEINNFANKLMDGEGGTNKNDGIENPDLNKKRTLENIKLNGEIEAMMQFIDYQNNRIKHAKSFEDIINKEVNTELEKLYSNSNLNSC